MYNPLTIRLGMIVYGVVVLPALAGPGTAIDSAIVRSLLDAGKLSDAIRLLVRETKENPAHEAARVWLAEAYERKGDTQSAIESWQDLMVVSRNDANLRTARRALSRLRRYTLEKEDAVHTTAHADRKDPFHIPMPDIDWNGLEIVEDSDYIPPILPPPYDFDVPPFAHETQHFTVYSTNERLSKVIGERAEIYLQFMIDKLFGGRSWPVRFPIIVYKTYEDYVRHGAPSGTGGVTMRHITGSTEFILLFQLKPDALIGQKNRTRGGNGIWKYGIESVLPHELTHAVVNEFFAGRPTPQWLHEAIAGRFEQTRDHYRQAARLARHVTAGEFFRLRELFDQKGYPERISLFYEQSAAIVLYLFETGAETMHVFLTELAEGHGHDAACAAALGIPKEHAVEEFERRWVHWMKARHDDDLDADSSQTAIARRSDNAVFRPWVNELDTVKQIDAWRTIKLDSLDAFAGVGNSKHNWSATGNMLRCKIGDDRGSTLLAMRINKSVPLAVKCTVKCLATPGIKTKWFGFTQLDADRNDTNVEVLTPLRDIATHEIVGILSDDLVLYVDGACAGRYPAFQVSGNAPDIDYPLALIADGPIEIEHLKIAQIVNFSDKPVPSADDNKNKKPRGRRGRRRRGP